MDNHLPRHQRILAICLAMLIVTAAAPPTVAAQDASGLEQNARSIYGESIIFRVRSTASVPLTGARLTVQVQGRGEQFVQSVPVNGADIEVTTSISVREDLALEPVAGLTYYWDVQDSSGRQLRSAPGFLWYDDTSVGWTWAAVQADSVIVHTDGRSPEVSEAAQTIAAEALEDARRALGQGLDGDVHVYVYPTLSLLANALRLHGLQVTDWVAAYAVPDQRVVLVAAEAGPGLVPALQRDIAHQMMHLAVHQAGNGSAPAWLAEGLALSTAPEPDTNLSEVLEAARSDNVVLSLSTLCGRSFSGMAPRDAALAYAQSHSLVQYINSRYGSSQTQALVAAYAGGLGCDDGVQLALGISLTELEQQWQADLAHQEPSSRLGRAGSLVPWAAIWVLSLLLALLFTAPQPTHSEERPFSDTRPRLRPTQPGNTASGGSHGR